ncbi:hypothetical protein [Azospirillum largimobile]
MIRHPSSDPTIAPKPANADLHAADELPKKGAAGCAATRTRLP